jgi:eukaryotic-like serine/threonine-protein kinase
LTVGVALSGGSALVLLEFVDGGSLDSLLRKGHEFTTQELPDFLGQITAGLIHIHKAKLVHRDLAARNILLSKDPATGRYTPKIAGTLKL